MATKAAQHARIPTEPVIPTTFSQLSVVSEVSTYEMRKGVVFGNLEQLEAALRTFGIGARVAKGTSRNLRSIANEADPDKAIIERIREIHRDDKVHKITGRYGLLAASFSSQDPEEVRAKNMERALASSRATGMSPSAFMHGGSARPDSHVRIVQIDGKYVLTVNLPGTVTEEKIASGVNAHLALTDASIAISYAPVDQLWFNVDLASYARVLGISKGDIQGLVAKVPEEGSWRSRVKIGVDNKFGVEELSIYLTSTNMHYEWRSGQISALVGIEGTRIFGASNWSTSREPKSAVPSDQNIELAMELPRDFPKGSGRKDREQLRYLPNTVADKERIDEILSRRDSLASALREALI